MLDRWLDRLRMSEAAPEGDALDGWRLRVLERVLFSVLLLGGLTALPSAFLAAAEGGWSIVVVDIVAIGWVALLWRLSDFSYEIRVWNFLLLVFLLGCWFFYKVGPVGNVYLLAVPVFAALLLGLTEVFWTLVLAGGAVFVIGLADAWALSAGRPFTFTDVWREAIIALNFCFIGGVLALSSAALLAGLERALTRQQQAHRNLHAQGEELGRVHEELRLKAAALTHLSDIVIITRVDVDAHARLRLSIVYVNEAFERLTGYRREEVTGQTPRMLEGINTQTDEIERIRTALLAQQAVHVELLNYTKSGQEYWFEADISPLTDAAGRCTHWVTTGRDTTGHRQSAQHIHQLAYFDELTGLPNRRLLVDRIGQRLASDRRSGMLSALLLIDLDHFKYVNDARGHSAGNAVLVQVSGRLRQLLREGDTLARVGGDEFVVLLADLAETPGAASHTAMQVADKIRHALAQAFDLEGLAYSCACSVGVTLFPKDGQDAEDLLREVDTAMHRAKADGRNQIAFFEAGMQSAIEQRLTMERDLGHALGAGQLHMYMQAQVDRLGRPIGAEMLIRWIHPIIGSVSPAMFIPVAEESGLILVIGDWVLQQGCQALVALHAAGWPISVSINVSPKQFRQGDFVQKVRHVLEQTGAPAEHLLLEVTEGLLIDNVQDTIERMNQLAALGVRFSIDDFGTGYSSLAYLKRLPLYELKIDKSFVQDTPECANGTAIVQSILSMAGHLGLRVVAEGVENRQQAEFLVTSGCEALQGFLFFRPMPVPQWLAHMHAISQSEAGREAAG